MMNGNENQKKASEWFLQRGHERLGPYTWDQLVSFAGRGNLDPMDMLWHVPSRQWRRAGDLGGLYFGYHSPAGSMPAKKKGICGPTCLVLTVSLLAIICLLLCGIVVATILVLNQDGVNGIFARQDKLDFTHTFHEAGGSFAFDHPSHSYYGLTVSYQGSKEGESIFYAFFSRVRLSIVGNYF